MSSVTRQTVKQKGHSKRSAKKGMDDDVRLARAEGAPGRSQTRSPAAADDRPRRDPRLGEPDDITTAPESGTR
jgi:hypothetical protein